MREVLEYYKRDILDYIETGVNEISNITEIRINMSAVFKCEYKGNESILKFFIVEDKRSREFTEYSMIHANKLLDISKCSAFPDIYYADFIEFPDFSFLITIEEKLPYSFSDGILKLYELTENDIINCASSFLYYLLNLYIIGKDYGFVSHRDLSFDNIMFDESYNIKMIDLGSAKSVDAETTAYHIVAPTKYFYSAPEYEELHKKNNKTEQDLIRAEIYTIGLLTLSLMNSLKENLFMENTYSVCGIVKWLNQNKREQNLGEKLKEPFKEDYINYVLLNIFHGDDRHTLYRLLKGMTDSSVSSRISDYLLIINILERGLK